MLRKLTAGMFAVALVFLVLGCSGDKTSGKKEDSKKAFDMFSRLDRESNELDKMRRSHSTSAQTPSPGGKTD